MFSFLLLVLFFPFHLAKTAPLGYSEGSRRPHLALVRQLTARNVIEIFFPPLFDEGPMTGRDSIKVLRPD